MATDNNSYVYQVGTTPVTRSALSNRSKVLSYSAGANGLTQLGMLTSLNPSHSRSIETRRGIGFGDKIAELIPQNADAVTISVERTMLYLSNIMQAFGYQAGTSGIVRSLAHHRFPFDVRNELVIPSVISTDTVGTSAGSNSENISAGIEVPSDRVIVTIYEACWFSDYSFTYSSDDVIVAESCTLTVSDVYESSDNSDGPRFINSGGSDTNSVRLGITV